MPRLTFTQIEQLWRRNGGTPGWAPLMAGIAMAESGGTTQALNTNPSTQDRSVGLWQINYFGNLYTTRAKYGTPAQLQGTPNRQARAAVAISTNGKNLTPWQTDTTWSAWQAAGRPYQPDSTTVQQWVTEQVGITTAPGPAWQSTIPTTPTVATARKASYPVPSTGERFAFPGEHTYSIVTPSVIPGVSATPPTSPSFGNNPVGDLATSLRFTGVFGGWAIMTIFVFILGVAMAGLGLVMLLLVLFGPATDAVVGAFGASRLLRSLSPGRRAARIERRTRLAIAKTKRATRDEAFSGGRTHRV